MHIHFYITVLHDICFRVRSQFSTPVHFCWFVGRDFLQAFGPCESSRTGWMPNFILYGGTNQTRNTITVYEYVNTRPARFSSNLFLRNDINQSHLELRRDTYYIPGIKWLPLVIPHTLYLLLDFCSRVSWGSS